MSLSKKVNPFIKQNPDTGFGVNPASMGERFINKDGSFNLEKTGLTIWKRTSLYNTMLTLPRWRFMLALLCFYILINLMFTSLYLIAGFSQLQGLVSATQWGKLREVFFFSTETFTTVGYGRVNPIGDFAHSVSAVESMSGFLSFAIVTGLIYGRFSKPKAFINFSEEALISPYGANQRALMFRLVAYKQSHTITDASVKVNLGLIVEEDGDQQYRFFSLDLERTRIDTLSMNWTVVHVIDENSPLFGLSVEDMKNADVEAYVLVRGFDDVYSSIVQRRTSYTYKEIVMGAKFVPMYHESEDGKTTILELDKLNDYTRVELPS
ncbi:ion channel [Deminuibacter soli]|uniref:Transporter n=1 Tax=Deminuibacter soli TaxID=2291815 RepID=A0A3E1NJ64_9BACT|nr:ion channel [Deminuibacter soli]RFM27864.1 transporter [Deminuibacter soli]